MFMPVGMRLVDNFNPLRLKLIQLIKLITLIKLINIFFQSHVDVPSV